MAIDNVRLSQAVSLISRSGSVNKKHSSNLMPGSRSRSRSAPNKCARMKRRFANRTRWSRRSNNCRSRARLQQSSPGHHRQPRHNKAQFARTIRPPAARGQARDERGAASRHADTTGRGVLAAAAVRSEAAGRECSRERLSEMVHLTLSETISVESVLGAGVWRVEVDPAKLESRALQPARGDPGGRAPGSCPLYVQLAFEGALQHVIATPSRNSGT